MFKTSRIGTSFKQKLKINLKTANKTNVFGHFLSANLIHTLALRRVNDYAAATCQSRPEESGFKNIKFYQNVVLVYCSLPVCKSYIKDIHS